MADTVITTWLCDFETILKFQVSLQGTDATVLLMMLIPCPQYQALLCLYVFPFPILPWPFRSGITQPFPPPPGGEVLRYL